MWKRDAGVSQMIEYFDKDLPLKYKIDEDDWLRLPPAEKFALMTPAEREAVLEQSRDITNDFSYAARNYFWITNKKKQDQLFSLWEGQSLILQKYYDLKESGKPQKIMIIKARQLGCSLLIEAMIAWRAMFFPNTNALVVSVNAKHAGYLFGLMLHIYDKLPWWLQPEVASREEKDGVLFDRRDPGMRGVRPGLNSYVSVQNFAQYSGVGQGIRLDAAHVSEYADPDDEVAEGVINEDMGHALSDDVEVFGFLESTAKGAGRFAHRLWRTMERRLESGKWPKWYPLFLPSFFETTRVLAPPQGWHTPKEEVGMRDRVKKEWLRCDNDSCRVYRPAYVAGEARMNTVCPECRQGNLLPVILTDAQLYWQQDSRENAADTSEQSLKLWKQEQCVTVEEAFQVSGYTLFNDKCQEWMNLTVSPPLKAGRIYRKTGEIHGADLRNDGHCYVATCRDDHRHDETPLLVWEEPIPGEEYCVGVDVAEGLGQDYSVIFVNRVGRRAGACDEQVAVWRHNRTTPKELAYYANVIGRWYNEALMCVEYNTYQTAGDDLLYVYHYPNVFRWKHKDKLRPESQTWHWWTKFNTKSYLHQTAIHWLQNCCWSIRSKNFVHESTIYVKDDYGARTAGAEEGFHDDELMAGMISLYCAHEMDCDESGRVPVPAMVEQSEPARFRMICLRCKFEWDVSSPEAEFRCPQPDCGCPRLRGRPLAGQTPKGMNLDQAMAEIQKGRDGQGAPEGETPYDHY